MLVAAGWSLAVLSLAFWAVEQRGWVKGRGKAVLWPWLVFGSNAIAIYMFSEMLPGILERIHFTAGGRRTNVEGWLVHTFFASFLDAGWAAFGWSVTFVLVCFIPAWLLYRKRIFIKV